MQNSRRSFSYNIREELRPHKAIEMILLNVFHGATDGLGTGWIDDDAKLKEMARRNLFFGNSTVVIGPNWKNRLGMQKADPMRLVRNLALPEHGLHDPTKPVKFLDGSRKVPHFKLWCGISEFLSNNKLDYLANEEEYKEVFENAEWF